MTDAATYFWPESDGWHFTCGFARLGPFKTFADCIAAWTTNRTQGAPS